MTYYGHSLHILEALNPPSSDKGLYVACTVHIIILLLEKMVILLFQTEGIYVPRTQNYYYLFTADDILL